MRHCTSTRLAALLAAAAWAAAAIAAPPAYDAAKATYDVTVTAAETGYAETPVWLAIDAPEGATWADMPRWNAADGPPAPCQLVREGDKAWVVFLLRDLQPAEARRYALALYDEPQSQSAGVVEVKPGTDSVEVSVGGSLFTRYHFAGVPKPFYYPIIGPGGAPMTRNYPMQEVAGESTDHPHQRSFWFAFGDVNGTDFWTEGENAGRMVHRAFEALDNGPVAGRIGARNDWVAPDGKKVCEDLRDLCVYNTRDGRLLDFAITITASNGPVQFGDTKEGMFAFRVASSMELNRGAGRIVNSEGQTDRAAWGQRASWCDYSGPVEGRTVGIAIFDHPDNLRHPSFWHVRDYGLFAANPFGLRAFLGEGTAEGGLRLEPGQSLTFRYRILLHAGAAEEANLAAVYAQYAHPPQTTVTPITSAR